jgi:hypothetical protein
MVRSQFFPKSIGSLCQNRSVCKTRRICRQLAVTFDFAFIGNGSFSMNPNYLLKFYPIEDVKRDSAGKNKLFSFLIDSKRDCHSASERSEHKRNVIPSWLRVRLKRILT